MWTAKRHVLALGVATLLAAYGIADIFMRGRELGGFWNGMTAAALDPGFLAFHVLLLPIAACLLLWQFPTALFSAAWSRRPIPFMLLGTLLVGWPIYVAVRDARDAVCVRLSPPEVFAKPTLRNCLAFLRRSQLVDDPGQPPAECPTPTHSVLLAESPQARWSALKDAYSNKLAAARGKECHYWVDSSRYAVFGSIGSSIAAAFAGFLLFLAFWPLLAPGQDTKRFWEVYLAILALIGLWLVLRPLSEWFLNFGTVSMLSYPPILLGFLAAAVALAGWIFHYLTRKGIPHILQVAVIGVSAFVGFLSHLAPAWLAWFADVLYGLPDYVVATIYILLAAFAGLLAWHAFIAHEAIPQNEAT